MEQQPSVGRIVHYVPDNRPDAPAPCLAAIMTDVRTDETVDLVVFDTHSSTHWHNVPNSEPVHQRGTWHWPERV